MIVTESKAMVAWGLGQKGVALPLTEDGRRASNEMREPQLPRGGQLLLLSTGEHLVAGKILFTWDEIVWVDLRLLKKAIYL